jgi:isoleucyl-tRNA synthetase
VKTELSDELLLEGMARDLVRNVQEIRKKAGFEISDRIVTYFIDPSDRLREVTAAFGKYIRQETLSMSLKEEASPPAGFEASFKLSGQPVKVVLAKVKASP